ncbi:major capsid protein [Caballeronia sp. KNU42]
MKKMANRVVVGAALAAASVGAFAQASSVSINDTAIVSTITGLSTNVQDIGGAVLAICAVVFGFRLLKGFIGR